MKRGIFHFELMLALEELAQEIENTRRSVPQILISDAKFIDLILSLASVGKRQGLGVRLDKVSAT